MKKQRDENVVKMSSFRLFQGGIVMDDIVYLRKYFFEMYTQNDSTNKRIKKNERTKWIDDEQWKDTFSWIVECFIYNIVFCLFRIRSKSELYRVSESVVYLSSVR